MKVEANFANIRTFKDWLKRFLEVEKEFSGDDLDLIIHIEEAKK